jgi:outer membrane protein assembly factor BamB
VIATPGGKKGAVAAFDKKTGALKWRTSGYTGVLSYSSLIAIKSGGLRQYVHITDNLIGLRASDGKLLWKSPQSSDTIGTPIYRGNCVYASSQYGCKLLKLTPDGDQFKVEQIYASRVMQNDIGGVVLLGDYLYGFSLGHGWVCQDFKTGKAVWRKKCNEGDACVTYADGNLYCYGDDSGHVLLIKATPAGYQEQGKLRIPETSTLEGAHSWTSLVVANGRLYFRDQDLIFCYDVRQAVARERISTSK